MFAVEFEKEAGIFQRLKDKIKSHFTGRETFYHGTSKNRAERIRKEGLNPDLPFKHMSESYGERDKGKVFLTKNKDIAQAYASRSTVDKRLKRLSAIARKHGLMKRMPKEFQSPKSRKQIRGILSEHIITPSPLINKTLFKGDIVELSIPKGHKSLKKMKPDSDILEMDKHVINPIKKHLKEKGHLRTEKALGFIQKHLPGIAGNYEHKGRISSNLIKKVK